MAGLHEISCFLFDNGSVRPESTLNLRLLANQLTATIGCQTVATSLLHSTRVDPADLNGEPAILLEVALAEFAKSGGRKAVALPLFFGPSAALTDYLPPRLTSLRSIYPGLLVRLADCLVQEGDDSALLVAQAMANQVQALVFGKQDLKGSEFTVISTDHGSPKAEVAEVRNRVGLALAHLLKKDSESVRVASMERRPGREYTFNEPLLADALDAAYVAGSRQIIVAQQFLAAGRHAGEGGDIHEICQKAEKRHTGLSVYRTSTIGGSTEVQALLQRRFNQAIKNPTWTQ